MVGLGKWLRVLWRSANALSTIQWLWGLLPAGFVAVIAGWAAKAEQLPPVTIGVLAFAAFALAYVIYVAWRIERVPRIPQRVLDQANRAATEHWIRPLRAQPPRRDDGMRNHLERLALESAKRCPEWPIWKAVEYVRKCIGDDDLQQCYRDTRVAIRQAALEDRLEIWGRREIPPAHLTAPQGASSVWTKIEPAYWQTHEIGALAITEMCEDRDHTWLETKISTIGDRYWSLKVSQARVERLWHERTAK